MIKKENGADTRLLDGNVGTAMLLFALPIFISRMFQQIYNAADTMIVGRILGEQSLAAIGSCTAIYDMMIGFGIGVGNGLGVVTARAFGYGDESFLKKSVFGGFLIELVMSILIMIAGAIWLKPLLLMLGTPEEILSEAASYIVTIAIGCSAMFFFNFFSGMLQAIGNSLIPLCFLILASILNVILDFPMIGSFGVRGAAFATVLAQALSAVLCLCYIRLHATILLPKKKDLQVEKKLYGELITQGLAMGFMSAIVCSGTIILQSSINAMGTKIIAGHTAARRMFMFVIMPGVSYAIASATFASQNYGAGKPDRVRRCIRIGIGMVICESILATIIILFFGKSIVTFLTGSTDSVIVNTANSYMLFTAPLIWITGILSCLRNSLQGLGEKRMPIISSVIELIGKILFTLWIVPRLGYKGVILCEPMIWVIMCSQLAWAFRHNTFVYPKLNRK